MLKSPLEFGENRSSAKVSSSSIVDFYRIHEFSAVLVYYEHDLTLTYKVLEPVLSPVEAEVLEELRRILLNESSWLRLPEPLHFKDAVGVIYDSLRELLRGSLKHLLARLRDSLQARGRSLAYSVLKLSYYIARDVFGYGPLDPLIRDPYVEDISGEGDSRVYVYHRVHGWLRTSVYLSREEADRLAKLLVLRARRNISVAHPISEGSLIPEGYRVHVALGVVTRRGSTFTIRKYAEEPFTLPRLVALHSIDPRIAGYLWLAVDNIVSMLIGGPMGSGKTTLLNTVAMLLKPEYKIVTLEDTPELFLPHENWVPLVTRPSYEPGVEDIGLYDLLRSSLRQRPEYLIIGEIRGEEAYTFFQAIAVGHGGLATIHGESVEHVVNRLRSPPMNVPVNMIPLVRVYILTRNYPTSEGLARRVTEVREAEGVDAATGRILLNTLASYDPGSDRWEVAPKSVVLDMLAERLGLSILELREEWERRATIMKYLAEKRLYDAATVVSYVKRYAVDPDPVYGEAEAYVGRVTIE